MKPRATFLIDGVLTQAPEEKFLVGSGKSIWEIYVEVAGYNGKAPQVYPVNVRDGSDVQGLQRGQRVRVEGQMVARMGNNRTFIDIYADSVLPFAGEPNRLGVQGRDARRYDGGDEYTPPPSGSHPQELGFAGYGGAGRRVRA